MNFGNTRWGGGNHVLASKRGLVQKKTGSAGFEPSREDHKSGALTTTLEGYNVRGWSAGGGEFSALGQRRVCEFWQYTLGGRKPRFGVKTRSGAKKGSAGFEPSR